MNINIITVGNLKEKYLIDACDEYKKRLQRFGKLQIIELKEMQGASNIQNVDKEGAEIIKKISTSDYIISLCIEGKQVSSVEFANLIDTTIIGGKSTITFIIGGSDGLSDKVKEMSNFKLSFSKMTLPHQLMRLVLLEQVYRAFKILGGEVYHK